MPDFDYEALAFYLALLTLICTGLYKTMGWFIKISRDVTTNKLEIERLEKKCEELKNDFARVNEAVMSFGVESYTRHSQLISELKESKHDD